MGIIDFQNKLMAAGFVTFGNERDFCRQCWKIILQGSQRAGGVSEKEHAELDSYPTRTIAELRWTSDCWCAVCEGCAHVVESELDPDNTGEPLYRVDVYVDVEGLEYEERRVHTLLRNVPYHTAEARVDLYNSKRSQMNADGYCINGQTYAMYDDEYVY